MKRKSASQGLDRRIRPRARKWEEAEEEKAQSSSASPEGQSSFEDQSDTEDRPESEAEEVRVFPNIRMSSLTKPGRLCL